MVNQALAKLDAEFQAMYAREGRPSIPPEKLRRTLLLQVLDTTPNARLLMEQLDYNISFPWFVGLFMDDTLIEAWACLKSFRPKDTPPPDGGGPNPEADFQWERRLNHPPGPTSDPEARLFRQGTGREAKLGFLGHVLMENRCGLIITSSLTAATGNAERDTAARLVGDLSGRHRITVGGDKAYDIYEFAQSLRVLNAVPHVAQNCKSRNSAIDGRSLQSGANTQPDGGGFSLN